MTILTGKMNVYDYGRGIYGFFFESLRPSEHTYAFFVSADVGDACRLCGSDLSCDLIVDDQGAVIGACPVVSGDSHVS